MLEDKISHLEARLASDPDSLLFLPLAEAYRGDGRLQEAEGALRSGLRHHPEHHSARAAGRPFRHLTAEEGADLQAIAARIVPTDDTPGATEAGAVWFMDEVLGGVFAGSAAELRAGLVALNEDVAKRTGHPRFALLDEAQQDELLRLHEESDWFYLARLLTLGGLFALPTYGGNRDHVGWTLIGFEHRHVWSPPFGHYDAQHEREGGDHG